MNPFKLNIYSPVSDHHYPFEQKTLPVVLLDHAFTSSEAPAFLLTNYKHSIASLELLCIFKYVHTDELFYNNFSSPENTLFHFPFEF